MTTPRVGVLLVGGFLGAGKTTLIGRLVRDPEVGPRLAVLVNELGALGLDEELIRGASETAALRTVQLDSGCLCCTLKSSLGEALHELARPEKGEPPVQIIVELSGAAIASEVHFSVSALSRDAPFYADGLVCVVDASRAQQTLTAEPELFRDQLSRADLVLLSKLDRAPRTEADAVIASLAPGARVVDCAFGEIDPQLLLGLQGQAPIAAAHHHHHHALAGRTVSLAAPVDEAVLEALLEDASPPLYRIKGIVDVMGPHGPEPRLVQCVGDQVELSPSSRTPTARLTFIGPALQVERWADPVALSRRLGVDAALVGTDTVGLP